MIVPVKFDVAKLPLKVVAVSVPATVTCPEAKVIKSVSEVWPIVVPSILTLSTVSALSVPN